MEGSVVKKKKIGMLEVSQRRRNADVTPLLASQCVCTTDRTYKNTAVPYVQRRRIDRPKARQLPDMAALANEATCPWLCCKLRLENVVVRESEREDVPQARPHPHPPSPQVASKVRPGPG